VERVADSDDFARAFGRALDQFLRGKGLNQSDAAKAMGLGDAGKARLNTYCHDSPKGIRRKPNAEMLYLLCVNLGFAFEYRGYKISAATMNGNGRKPPERRAEQLLIEFDGQFNLTDQTGTVSISVKRPPGRTEVGLSLKGASLRRS
jgi:transcriptional regulator with XRE-family HTH domain